MATRERLVSVPAARSYVEVAIADPIMKATVNNVLDAIPAVDAVEVVRCRDCKKGHPELTRCDDVVWCAKWGTEMKLDSFCSYGERRCNHA